jgi:predicted DNA-binding transcriptional regulator YafY
MRRSERLFQIIQILRGSPRPVTAAALAAELEVAKRTVYRDIAQLIGQRVPIRGEAGLGYVMESGYDMPPLMLTSDEVEALVLGAHWVMGRSDASLANAARDLIAKVVDVIPPQLQTFILEPSLGPKPMAAERETAIEPAAIRSAVREGWRLRICYRDEAGEETERTVWPVILGYSDTTRTLVAWCELRNDFRHFRTDRIVAAERLDLDRPRPADLRRRWIKWRESHPYKP